jgi:hypothetical protein
MCLAPGPETEAAISVVSENWVVLAILDEWPEQEHHSVAILDVSDLKADL